MRVVPTCPNCYENAYVHLVANLWICMTCDKVVKELTNDDYLECHE